MVCSVSRIKGELHPAKIVQPEAYLFILHLDDSLECVPFFLVSPLPETATAYTLPHGYLTICTRN